MEDVMDELNSVENKVSGSKVFGSDFDTLVIYKY